VLRGALAAVALLTACAPEPRWIAVASDTTRQLVVFSTELRTADTVSLAGTLGRAEHLTGITAGADGSTLYLSVTDGHSGSVVWARRDGARLADMAVAADSIGPLVLLRRARTLVVGIRDRATGGGAVTFLPATLSDHGEEIAVCRSPVRALRPFADEQQLYVACADDEIAQVDTRLRVLVQTASLPRGNDEGASCDPRDLELSENQTVLFVLCGRSGRILYLDRARLSPLDSADIGAPARAFIRPTGGDLLLVLIPTPPRAIILVPRTHQVIGRVDLPGSPRAVDVGPDGRFAYVVAGEGPVGQIFLLDLVQRQVARAVPLGATSVGPALWPRHESPVMRWE
jgi:hypothetical protein